MVLLRGTYYFSIVLNFRFSFDRAGNYICKKKFPLPPITYKYLFLNSTDRRSCILSEYRIKSKLPDRVCLTRWIEILQIVCASAIDFIIVETELKNKIIKKFNAHRVHNNKTILKPDFVFRARFLIIPFIGRYISY